MSLLFKSEEIGIRHPSKAAGPKPEVQANRRSSQERFGPLSIVVRLHSWSDCLLRARLILSHDDSNEGLFRPSWGTRTETMPTRSTTIDPGLLIMYASSPVPVLPLSKLKPRAGTPSQTWGVTGLLSSFFSPVRPL